MAEPFEDAHEYELSYVETTKSRIAEATFNLRSKPFSLKTYPQYYTIYDIDHPRIVIMSGRQVGKSTTESVFQVSECLGIHDYPSLYTAPSLDQMSVYSVQRVAPLIESSPTVKRFFVNASCRRNVKERSFLNGSVMMFRAMSQLESLRGITTYRWFLDEVQDYVSDDIPVVEETMSSAPPGMKRMMYTGTAKTSQNFLENIWRKSTMNEWIVKCSECGSHNLPSIENIGPEYFWCKRCKARCDVTNGYWLSMKGALKGKDAEILGYHVPQIILPMHQHPEKWADVVYKMENYSIVKFMNEVMGISAGTGVTWITVDDLRECCKPEYAPFKNLYNPVEGYAAVFATIDWGQTARRSYTILSIWGMTGNGRVKLLFAKRFMYTDPLKQIEEIIRYSNDFNVEFYFNDWGSGFGTNDLLRQNSRRPVFQCMYVGEQRHLLVFDKNSRAFKVNRTQAMTETFVQMRKHNFHFFQWEDSADAYGFGRFADDILCIFEEQKDDQFDNDKIKFDHPEGSADDFFHTCVYANLSAHLLREGKLQGLMGLVSQNGGGLDLQIM